jgi:hypothetical protein
VLAKVVYSLLAKENKKTYKTKTRNFKRFHVMDMEEMRKYFLNKERKDYEINEKKTVITVVIANIS